MTIKALDASRLSVSEFAAREGLDPNRLYRWRSRLDATTRRVVPTFVEIKAGSIAPIEVVLRTGRVLRVTNGFDERTMERLVRLLEQGASEC